MKKILWVLLICSIAYAQDDSTKAYGSAVIAEITSIYDGDTFRGNIKDYPPIIGERIGIRITGIDCPELKDKRPKVKEMALQAKQYTVKRLREAKKIELVNMRRDKYFRILATVLVDGSSLGDELIKAGLAKSYDGGTKKAWN
jgi:endonuclease YncB( thermonuclease family)